MVTHQERSGMNAGDSHLQMIKICKTNKDKILLKQIIIKQNLSTKPGTTVSFLLWVAPPGGRVKKHIESTSGLLLILLLLSYYKSIINTRLRNELKEKKRCVSPTCADIIGVCVSD